MTTRMTATEAKAKFLALLDQVERGETVEITRHGKLVAQLAPRRDRRSAEGMFKGRVWTTDPNDDLLTADESWALD